MDIGKNLKRLGILLLAVGVVITFLDVRGIPSGSSEPTYIVLPLFSYGVVIVGIGVLCFVAGMLGKVEVKGGSVQQKNLERIGSFLLIFGMVIPFLYTEYHNFWIGENLTLMISLKLPLFPFGVAVAGIGVFCIISGKFGMFEEEQESASEEFPRLGSDD